MENALEEIKTNFGDKYWQSNKNAFFGHTLEINQIQSFQVHFSSVNNESDGVIFKIYCPCQYNSFPHKLIMYQDRSVGKNVRYQNICSEKFLVNVAYNEDYSFKIVNNSMVVYYDYHGNSVGTYSYISFDFEILSSFFLNNNIIPFWINCNYTWGTYSYETGKWTGALGQVKLLFTDLDCGV